MNIRQGRMPVGNDACMHALVAQPNESVTVKNLE